MEHLSQFWSQDQLAITIGALVMLVLVVFVLLASRKRYGQKIDAKLADDLAKGNYEAAAEHELKAGRLRTAYDLFLRAQQPLRAAHIAVRQARLQDAAELFEKAGVRNRAADLYRQLGMTLKAEELLAEDAKVARAREEERAVLRQKLAEDPDGDEAAPIAKPAPAARVRADAAKAGTPPPSVKVSALPAKPNSAAKTPSPDAGAQALAEKGAPLVLAMATTPGALGGDSAGLGSKPSPSPTVAAPAPAAPPHDPAVEVLDFGDAKPVLQELSFGDAEPAAAPLSLDEGTGALQELSFGDAKPATETLPFGAAPAPRPGSAAEAPAVAFSFDEAESGPVSAPTIEGLPEAIPPESNLTPRTPAVSAGASVGSYRMVRPSQPDVFTPPPAERTPAPTRKSGERALPPQKTPTPRPTLRMGTKSGSGERRAGGTPAPATLRIPVPGAPNPRTPTPAPRTGPSGTRSGPSGERSRK